MNVAGIDMGSNAIRVTIAKSSGKNKPHNPRDLIIKERFPCRLGSDVFKSQTISQEKEFQLHSIFEKIDVLLDDYNVEKIAGVATSAFREADNGSKILKDIEKIHNIRVDIISGKLEAKYMAEGIKTRGEFDEDLAHLHMDIGGGSLELSLYCDGKFHFQESLDIGTLRLLVDTRTGQLIPNYSKQLDLIDPVFTLRKVKKIIEEFETTGFLIHGTGGNFRRLGKLRKFSLDKTKDTYIQSQEIPFMLGTYMNYSGYELSKHVPLKEENAALIVPSLLIIQRVLNFWPASKIKIPNMSLSHALLDGL